MKLLKLYSNLKGFKTINFNQSGISLISGISINNETPKKDKQKLTSTYNGVGKTFLFYLIDYCLGTKDIAAGFEQLECNFFLDILIDNETITLMRNSKNPKIHKLYNKQNKEIKIEGTPKIKEFMNYKCINDKVAGISFRSILGFFLRYKETAFVKEISIYDKSEEYNNVLNSAYLLGIDINYITEKNKYNKNNKSYTSTLKKLEDKEIKEILASKDKDLKLTVKQLNTQIETLKLKIKNFKISDNFSELNSKLKMDKNKLQDILNEIFIVNKRIKVIKESLNEKIDVSTNDVFELYKNLEILFSNSTLKELNEVENFHHNLLENRKERFLKDLNELKKESIKLTKKKEELQQNINELYKILSSSGDLKDYDAINKNLTTLEIKKSKIDNYLEAVKNTNDKILETKALISRNNDLANKYIANIEEYLKESNELFSQMISELYGDVVGRISVDINEGENNGVQFKINTKISQSDSSTGITRMKILAFDNVLLNKEITKFKFLAHDDKIFTSTDSKQVAAILRYLYLNNKNDFQYIFSIGQNVIDNLKEQYSENEYENIIEKNIVLSLNGEDDTNKLLGEQINIIVKN